MPPNPDAPQSAARRLLAAGEWVTAAGYADLLGAALPEPKALACYARLVRNGTGAVAARADRLRTGRVRLAQEALQRLVQRGECEAVGTGPDRAYRMKESPVFSPRPKPTRETVPFDALAFDPRLQMRALGGLLFDDDAAAEYAERMEAGDQFPLIEAVKEIKKGKQPVYWVFSGFTRGGAYALREAHSVECLVYDGAFDDAQFYALSENRKHGQPARPGDKSKAVRVLLDSPAMMSRVREAARQRDMRLVMAAACGVGERTVTHVLNERSLRIQGTRLLTKEPPAEPSSEDKNVRQLPDVLTEREQSEEPDDPVPQAPGPATGSAVNGSPEFDMAEDQLTRVATALRSVGRDVEAILAGKAGDILRHRAKLEGAPFLVTERKVEKHMPHEVVTERYETWPALAAMQAVFAQVSAQIAELEAGKGK